MGASRPLLFPLLDAFPYTAAGPTQSSSVLKRILKKANPGHAIKVLPLCCLLPPARPVLPSPALVFLFSVELTPNTLRGSSTWWILELFHRLSDSQGLRHWVMGESPCTDRECWGSLPDYASSWVQVLLETTSRERCDVGSSLQALEFHGILVPLLAV